MARHLPTILRRLASAILIFILLFNLFGYRFVADYIQVRNDRQLEARLDKDKFNESELVELKVPIHLPYQNSWSDFERYDGEVKLDGILYKYVKRKISNDTLIVLCIPNQQKMDLISAKNDFFKTTADLAQTSSSKKSGTKTIDFTKLVTEYDGYSHGFRPNSINSSKNDLNAAYLLPNLLSSPHLSPEQPPDTGRA